MAEGDEMKPVAGDGGMFSGPPAERTFPTTAVAIASVAVVILVAVLVMLGRRGPAVGDAAYAPNLAITDVAVSQATSLAGGTTTYVDGKIANHGPLTVSGVQVRVEFASDQKTAPPQMETAPMLLVRSRDAYVDTEAVSAEPLLPGAQREFRLIFENVGDTWNQRTPQVRVTAVQTR